MEVSAAMLLVQLTKLQAFNDRRRQNMNIIAKALRANSKFITTMQIMEAAEGTDPAWFGLVVILHRGYVFLCFPILVSLRRNPYM